MKCVGEIVELILASGESVAIRMLAPCDNGIVGKRIRDDATVIARQNDDSEWSLEILYTNNENEGTS